MARYLIDSDAWLALRKLSVLELMTGADTLSGPLLMGEYAARHELSSISGELSVLEQQNLLYVCCVHEKTKKQHIRNLIKEGTDKGEAEAVVWSLAQDVELRPYFISIDRKARWIAREKGLTAGDIFDLIVDLVDEHVLDIDKVQLRLLVWEDRSQQLGRPADFTNFREMLHKRRHCRWSG